MLASRFDLAFSLSSKDFLNLLSEVFIILNQVNNLIKRKQPLFFIKF